MEKKTDTQKKNDQNYDKVNLWIYPVDLILSNTSGIETILRDSLGALSPKFNCDCDCVNGKTCFR